MVIDRKREAMISAVTRFLFVLFLLFVSVPLWGSGLFVACQDKAIERLSLERAKGESP